MYFAFDFFKSVIPKNQGKFSFYYSNRLLKYLGSNITDVPGTY